MLKFGGVVLLILVVFYAKADSNDFFMVPEKSLRFIHKSTKQPIAIASYSLAYETKFDCLDAACKKFRGNSTSRSEMTGDAGSFKTMLTKIPKMPNSGALTLTFILPGVCRSKEKCTASIPLDEFIAADDPLVFAFDYDEEASAQFRKKRQEAEAQSLSEIEDQMGKPIREVSSLTQVDPWKKLGEDFLENRKKLNPMSYSDESLTKLGLSAWFCGKNLSDKIAKCEVHACIYTADVKSTKSEISPVKSADDLIIHGFNKAGNCAISLPGGKRFFVPKAELSFFYPALEMNSISSVNLADPCQDLSSMTSCREKKTDLLFQLNSRHLMTEYIPVKMNVVSEK